MIRLKKELEGSILDIGGGGEGIIGRLYQKQVTAIDNRQEELDEAPNSFKKVLMDAADLKFESDFFDNVTFFFTLMYMSAELQAKAINEAVRVMKAGGKLCIWDCEIESAYPDPFIVNLQISLPEEQINTTYGVEKYDKQNVTSILSICEKAGLELVCHENGKNYFYLEMTLN